MNVSKAQINYLQESGTVAHVLLPTLRKVLAVRYTQGEALFFTHEKANRPLVIRSTDTRTDVLEAVLFRQPIEGTVHLGEPI